MLIFNGTVQNVHLSWVSPTWNGKMQNVYNISGVNLPRKCAHILFYPVKTPGVLKQVKSTECNLPDPPSQWTPGATETGEHHWQPMHSSRLTTTANACGAETHRVQSAMLASVTKTMNSPSIGMNLLYFRTMAGAVSDMVTITSIPSCLHESGSSESAISWNTEDEQPWQQGINVHHEKLCKLSFAQSAC